MLKPIIICIIFYTTSIEAQSGWQQFKKLSPSKKTWTLLHPFKAQKALLVSQEAKRVADSIKHSPLLDGDPSGGQVDAFRHAYWMARLRQEIGEKAARSLGKAHEKENYQTYKKRKLEDGIVPDEVATLMDLFNNDVGLTFTVKNSKTPKQGLIYRIINAIHQGKLKIVKKNSLGQFLTCEGIVIEDASLVGKWKNNKCLVPSN